MSGNPWDPNAVQRERDRDAAGFALGRLLVDMYAGAKPVSAKTLCECCWYAREAGLDNSMIGMLALGPGQKSLGNYQQHLDRVLPRTPASTYYWIDIPVASKHGRKSRPIPMVPVHEAIQREVESNPELRPEHLARDPDVQDIRTPADGHAQNGGSEGLSGPKELFRARKHTSRPKVGSGPDGQ